MITRRTLFQNAAAAFVAVPAIRPVKAGPLPTGKTSGDDESWDQAFRKAWNAKTKRFHFDSYMAEIRAGRNQQLIEVENGTHYRFWQPNPTEEGVLKVRMLVWKEYAELAGIALWARDGEGFEGHVRQDVDNIWVHSKNGGLDDLDLRFGALHFGSPYRKEVDIVGSLQLLYGGAFQLRAGVLYAVRTKYNYPKPATYDLISTGEYRQIQKEHKAFDHWYLHAEDHNHVDWTEKKPWHGLDDGYYDAAGFNLPEESLPDEGEETLRTFGFKCVRNGIGYSVNLTKLILAGTNLKKFFPKPEAAVSAFWNEVGLQY